MKTLPLVLTALLAATAPLAAAPAEKTALKPASIKPDNIDVRAVALIDKSIAAYGKFKSLSQPFVISTMVGDKKRADISGTYSFARPNFARAQYEIRGVRTKLAVSDGKTLIRQSDAEKFVQEESHGNPTREVIGGMPGGTAPFFISLLNGVNEFKVGFSSVKFASLPKSEIVTAKTEQFTYSLVFDSTTYLLSSMSYEGEFQGAKVAETTTFGQPEINVDPAMLAFVLPKGATLEQATSTPENSESYDPRLVVGATPFPLSGNTLDGTALSLDSMKGKVVLLDFWATWCGPCIEVLPNLKANYDKYHAQGFEVMGISLDEDEELLRSFVKEKAMPWPQLFDGKGWEAGDAKAYSVQAIPFTLLIGKDGAIVAVNPGVGELSDAIEKALAQ